jgi:RTX calcium-binding nonapeptide repeat (4 copies)
VRRVSVVVLLAMAALVATGLMAVPSRAGAAVTIGQVAPGPSFNFANSQVDYLQPTVTSGSSYVVPAAGIVASWSHNALGEDPGQMLTMKVFRKVADPVTYMVVGHDGPRPLVSGALNTFPASIPVRAGDVLGLNTANASPAVHVAYGFPGPNTEVFLERLDSDLADGQSGAFDVIDSESTRINMSAVVEPDCDQDGLGDETQDPDISSCAPGTTPTGPGTTPTGPAPTLPGGAPATCRGLPATIVGTPGNDVRTGTPGRDVIAGLGGNDTLSGLAGNDVICGGRGKDTLKGGKGKDTLLGQKGNDTLKGGPGSDKLSGKKGKDKLIGGGGKDKLKGGGGRDVCIGGKANDKASKCEVEKSI